MTAKKREQNSRQQVNEIIYEIFRKWVDYVNKMNETTDEEKKIVNRSVYDYYYKLRAHSEEK